MNKNNNYYYAQYCNYVQLKLLCVVWVIHARGGLALTCHLAYICIIVNLKFGVVRFELQFVVHRYH